MRLWKTTCNRTQTAKVKKRTLDEESNNGSFHDRMLPAQRGQER